MPGGNERIIEGRKTRVTWKESQRLKLSSATQPSLYKPQDYLKDGEPCLSRANAGRLVAILTFTSFVMLGEKGDRSTACFTQDS